MLNLKLAAAAVGVLLCAACSKPRKQQPEPRPAFSYRSLNDTEVRYLKPFLLDFDEDNQLEIFFFVGVLIDDEGTHARFGAAGWELCKLLSRPDSLLRLNEGDEIPVLPRHPNEWNGLAYLCKLLLPAANPQDSTWTGAWLPGGKKFMGVQFQTGEDTFMGWVSLSVDTARDCMILHDCAWRRVEAGTVRAGKRSD